MNQSEKFWSDEQMSEDFNKQMSEGYNLPIEVIEQVSEKYKNETPQEFLKSLKN